MVPRLTRTDVHEFRTLLQDFALKGGVDSIVVECFDALAECDRRDLYRAVKAARTSRDLAETLPEESRTLVLVEAYVRLVGDIFTAFTRAEMNGRAEDPRWWPMRRRLMEMRWQAIGLHDEGGDETGVDVHSEDVQ